MKFVTGCIVDYVYQSIYKRIRHSPDTSFEDWVINRFGKKLYNTFFKDYTRKLWGIPPDKLSSDWAAERISLLNLWDVVLRLYGFREEHAQDLHQKLLLSKAGYRSDI